MIFPHAKPYGIAMLIILAASVLIGIGWKVLTAWGWV